MAKKTWMCSEDRRRLDEALFFAARMGSLKGVQDALARGASPNAQGGRLGQTALMAAIQTGQEECAVLLIPVSNLEARDRARATALGLAAAGKSLRIVEALLAAGASAQARNERGAKPLWIAARAGREDFMQRLLPHGEGRGGDGWGSSLLMVAAQGGSLACVEVALRSGSPRRRGSQGDTALMMAAAGDQPHCVRRLLPLSDPGAANVDGNTALLLAASHGSIACFEELVDASDLFVKNKAGQGVAELAGAGANPELGAVVRAAIEREEMSRMLGAAPVWRARIRTL